jgi:hypothetical protein
MANTELTIAGARSPIEVMAQRQLLEEIYKSVMIPGIDYGMIPGTKERALLKPGAEVLRLGFNFEVEMTVSKEVDLASDWVSIDSRCTLRDFDGRAVGQADANANSFESKFRYRWVSDKQLPQHVDKDTLITREQRGAYGNYTQYRLPTEDVGGLIHTLIRYSQKRAFVAAIHQATGASRIFREADEDEVEAGGKPSPARGKPAPARGKAKVEEPAPNVVAKTTTEIAVAPPTTVAATSGPPTYPKEPSSVTRESQAKVNAYMKADDTGLTARQVIHKKGWDLKNTGELSEYQAQVIIAVCEGRDEKDVA